MDDTSTPDGRRTDQAAGLTRWFEHRLDEMVPPSRAVVRRYGLEVIDAAGVDRLEPGAVRAVFMCEAGDVASMCSAGRDHGFDATAVVEWAWVSPPQPPSARPGQFGGRRRMRFVTVEIRQ